MPRTAILMRHPKMNPEIKGLTELGIKHVQDVARQLMEAEIIPDVVLHSETDRTRFAAEVMVTTFKQAGKSVGNPESSGHLNEVNRTSIAWAIEELAEQLNTGQVLLAVSHAPNIGRTIDIFAGHHLQEEIGFAQAIVLTHPKANRWDEFLKGHLKVAGKDKGNSPLPPEKQNFVRQDFHPRGA